MAHKQYFVTLKLSSSILSQFPDLTNVPPTKHHKLKTKLKLKHKYEPNESSPLANPKAISTSSKSKLLGGGENDTDTDATTTKAKTGTATTAKRALAINTKSRPSGNSSVNPPSSPITQDLPSRGGTPVPGKQSLGTVNTASSGFTGNSLRVGGLTMNSNTVVELDKSGRPAKKWIRKTADTGKLVRSFSGFNMHFSNWQLLEIDKNGSLEKVENKEPVTSDFNSNEGSATGTDNGGDSVTPAAAEVDSPLKQEVTA